MTIHFVTDNKPFTLYLGELNVRSIACGDIEPTDRQVYVAIETVDGEKICFRVPAGQESIFGLKAHEVNE